ncbi:hypothetical protein D9M73_234030 [compost metagenome]
MLNKAPRAIRQARANSVAILAMSLRVCRLGGGLVDETSTILSIRILILGELRPGGCAAGRTFNQDRPASAL